MSTRQCGCCWLPYRSKGTRAYVVERGALNPKIVCPDCVAKGTLIVAPPQERGVARAMVKPGRTAQRETLVDPICSACGDPESDHYAGGVCLAMGSGAEDRSHCECLAFVKPKPLVTVP